MALSPINQLRNLINVDNVIKRGKITKIYGNYMTVSTGSEIINIRYIAGYRVGQFVLLNPDNTLKGKAGNAKQTPIYIV